MGWAGSDILYIIDEEILCPKGKLGDRRVSGSYSRDMSGLSDFYIEDQTGLTLMDFARGIHRSSTKKTC
jgi:hypothetical protein